MRRITALLVLAVATTGPAAAHVGPDDGPGILPPALFLSGVVVLGVSVYLDHRGMADRRADAGVAVGTLSLVVGIVALFV